MLSPGGVNIFDLGPAIQWRYLRSMRAQPTAAAAGDKNRRTTFAAALEQAQQLFKAAESGDVMTRPISIYYGLNQAGRAIAAAANNMPTRDQTPGKPAEP